MQRRWFPRLPLFLVCSGQREASFPAQWLCGAWSRTLAIFAAPTFFLAKPFNLRISVAVQGRNLAVFAISATCLWELGFYHGKNI
jgi:hypothetical protein